MAYLLFIGGDSLIHITNGQTDIILDFIQEEEFWEDKHYKSLKDTLETFDFVTFADKRFSEHLAKGNRIIIPDEDGKYVEFVIENTREYRDSNGGLYVEVYTSATYIELTKAKIIKPQTTPAWTAKQHAEWALAGTEWEVGDVDFSGSRTLIIEEHTNPYAYLKRLATEFDLELHFRVEVDGNKVVRRYVDLVERVGMWRGREVEFGKDLIGIERIENNANIVTALIGLGPEREDGTRLEVFVEDKDALARWGRNGQHLIEVYEPESTDQTMTEERLRELTKNELEKRINSIVEYTADIADLEKVPGLEHEKIRFGDTIKIKDTGFEPPLYLEARVHTQERSIKKNGYKTVTLGDYIEYTEEEVMAIWKSLKAEIAKKVSMSDVTEVVYTKPEVDSKDAGVYQDSTYYADNVSETKKQEAIQVAATDATNKANQAETNAKQHAEQKAAEAQAAAEAVAIAEAELAETQAKAYADGIVTAEEQARIQQAQQNLAEAKAYAEQKAQEAQDAAEQYVNTQLTNYVTAVMYQQDIAELQNQIDGNITSWFYAHEPTLTNEPAVNWTTNNLKNQHLGDIFYNTSNGYSYRFAYENGTYKWLLLKDSDVQKALADAAKAQDTADAKRRVFVSQPVPPYDVGDLWVQGTNGDIMRCQTAKVAGQSYSSSDWVKASKYTDDTRAIQAENNAKSHANSIAEQKKQEAINAAIADAETKINAAKSELEADIATKVDAEWVNGQLVLKENAITKSNTAPASPTTGQLWLDTSTTPNVLKRWAGSAWVKATPTSAGEVGAYTKTEVDNALNSKVSVTQYNTDMNGVVNRLNSAESRITQNENEIATKVSNTTYQQDKTTINNNISQLQTKMSNAETSITQLSSEIALKANKTDVYTKSQIDGQMTTINQQITNLSAQLTVQADQIATKVSQTDFETGLNSIGRWTKQYRVNTDNPLPLTEFDGSPLNDLYTYEVTAKTTGTSSNTTAIAIFKSNKVGTSSGSGWTLEKIYELGTNSNHPEFFIDEQGRPSIRLYGHTTFYYVEVTHEKVIGRQNSSTVLGTRVSSAETSITQLSNQIQLKANQTTVDALTNQISSAQSQINLLSDQIQLKVDKNGVISAINVSSEGVRIDGAKVRITGQTTIDNGVIKNAHIDNLKFDKLQGGTATLGGNGNGNGLLQVLDANNSLIFRADQNGIVDGQNRRILGAEGLLSTFNFMSSGPISGWQECAWWGWEGSSYKAIPSIRFFIPDGFVITKAELRVYSLPVYWQDTIGGLTQYIQPRGMKLFKLNDYSNQFYDYPLNSDNVGIAYRSGSAVDITQSVWGVASWNADESPYVYRMLARSGDITNHVRTGYNEFYIDTFSGIQTPGRNTGLIQFVAVVQGYQKAG